MLRFGNPNPWVDSTQQTEDLGSDAVAGVGFLVIGLFTLRGAFA